MYPIIVRLEDPKQLMDKLSYFRATYQIWHLNKRALVVAFLFQDFEWHFITWEIVDKAVLLWVI